MMQAITLDKVIVVLFTIARIVAAVALVWALAPNPYVYYELLRLLVCAVCMFGIFCAVRLQQASWSWVFGALILLFNPLVRLPFQRLAWNVLDVATAAFLIATIFLLKPAKSS